MNPLFLGFIKAGLAIAVNTVVNSLAEGMMRKQQIQQHPQSNQMLNYSQENQHYNPNCSTYHDIQVWREMFRRIG